ncbi:NAD(P)-binding domain-containing protein [Nocardioides sp. NPDC006303]|uniref:NAD(P)-binding domain-containing protein n=1 Tax=Nocardioides sp. NPDC006303 TaxID=3156747 RepID=UPI0033ADD5C2
MTSDQHIAMIGCGNIGAALARCWRDSGRHVTVWNRTRSKVETIGGDGISIADSVQAAVDAAPVIIVSVSTYADAEEALRGVTIDGKTVINLTTGTPTSATTLDADLRARGARYADGALIAYPQFIGTDSAQIMLAGPSSLWEAHSDLLLTAAGGSRHVGQSVTSANVLDVAVVGAFYTSAITAFIESSAYVSDHGIEPSVLIDTVTPLLSILAPTIEGLAAAVATGDFTTDQATLSVYDDAATAWVAAIREHGHRAAMLGTASELLASARSAGHGNLSIGATAHLAKV